MSSLWIWSALSNYSTKELEEHKIYLNKVIEFRRRLQLMDLAHVPHFYAGGFHLTYELEQNIKEIDEELERRKKGALLLENGSFLLLEDGSRLLLEEPKTLPPVEPETLKEQLELKDKTIAILQRAIEGLTNELEHEKIHSDNKSRIINWLSGLNGSFYKNDVDDEDDE